MVEQRTENPRVPSSILGGATMKSQGLGRFRPGPFILQEAREERTGEGVPGGGGGIPGGVNAPAASGREPAGATEGGDHHLRHCRTRGEANRV